MRIGDWSSCVCSSDLGAEVSLSAAEGKMQVKAGRSNFNLPTLPRDDFPMIAEGDLPTSFELPVAELIQIIDKTRFAISTEETLYYLNGIFLHVAEDATGPVLQAQATEIGRASCRERRCTDVYSRGRQYSLTIQNQKEH